MATTDRELAELVKLQPTQQLDPFKGVKKLPLEEFFTSGHRTCQGCESALVMKMMVKAAGPRTIVLGSTGCFEEKKVATWSSATGPEAYERLFWESVKQKDWKEVRNRLAPSFVAISTADTLDKEATLTHFQKMQLDQFSIGEVEVHPNGAEMVVTYSISTHGTLDGHPLDLNGARMMSVWQQVKGGWIMIAHANGF